MSEGKEIQELDTFVSRTKVRALRLIGGVIWWLISSGVLSWLLTGPETPHVKIGAAFVISVFLIAVTVYKTVFWIDFGNVKHFVDVYPMLSKTVGVMIILLIGCTLLFVKRNARLAYGLVETGCALAFGWQAVSGLNNGTFPELFAFVASIYFTVRGVENSYLGFGELRDYVNVLAKENVMRVLKGPAPPPALNLEQVERIREVAGALDRKIRPKSKQKMENN